MDYEKKYKEALEKAHKLCAYPTSKPFISDLQDLFPELKESEDEKIRKEILDFCKNRAEKYPNDPKYKNISAWIDWLEKQCEQKPAETVKWSPQEESCICQLESLVKEQWRQADKVHDSVNIKKMSELMFFLKTLNPNKKPQRIISAEAKEAMYDKPAWSEEDEKGLGDALWCCKQAASIAKNENDMGNVWFAENWLKSLKDRVQPQPQQEWSENEKDRLNKISKYLRCKGYEDDACWLKSLKQRYTWKPSDEQMEALKGVQDGVFRLSILQSLYDDLLKLTK